MGTIKIIGESLLVFAIVWFFLVLTTRFTLSVVKREDEDFSLLSVFLCLLFAALYFLRNF